MPTSDSFVDTNVLVYAVDSSAGIKHDQAVSLVDELTAEQRLFLSVQVLNEFYWTITRPYKLPALTHQDAFDLVKDLANYGFVLPINDETTLLALEAYPCMPFLSGMH